MNMYRVTLRCTVPMSAATFEYTVEAETSEQAAMYAREVAYDRCYNRAEHLVTGVELLEVIDDETVDAYDLMSDDERAEYLRGLVNGEIVDEIEED